MATLTRSRDDTTVFDVYAETCPSRALLSLVTGRWAVLVFGALQDGPVRFGALRRRLAGISQKVLTDKLRDLEREGLVARTVVERPLEVHYELTPVGRGLVEPLAALHRWAEAHCDARLDQHGGDAADGR